MTLEIQENHLRTTLTNQSSGTVRIWEQSNSWGWGTFILIINTSDAGNDCYRLVPKPQIWTANLPRFINISPGKQQIFEVSSGKPEWDNLNSIEHLKHSSFYVRAALCIPETSEAIEFNVFIGKILSPQKLSQPPHAWLFPGASDHRQTEEINES